MINITRVLQVRPNLTVTDLVGYQASDLGYINIVFDYSDFNKIDACKSLIIKGFQYAQQSSFV